MFPNQRDLRYVFTSWHLSVQRSPHNSRNARMYRRPKYPPDPGTSHLMGNMLQPDNSNPWIPESLHSRDLLSDHMNQQLPLAPSYSTGFHPGFHHDLEKYHAIISSSSDPIIDDHSLESNVNTKAHQTVSRHPLPPSPGYEVFNHNQVSFFPTDQHFPPDYQRPVAPLSYHHSGSAGYPTALFDPYALVPCNNHNNHFFTPQFASSDSICGYQQASNLSSQSPQEYAAGQKTKIKSTALVDFPPQEPHNDNRLHLLEGRDLSMIPLNGHKRVSNDSTCK